MLSAWTALDKAGGDVAVLEKEAARLTKLATHGKTKPTLLQWVKTRAIILAKMIKEVEGKKAEL